MSDRFMNRRDLMRGSAATAIALSVWPTQGAFADTASSVTIVPFSDSGERQPAASVPKVVKTEAEWKAKLNRAVFSDDNIATTIQSCSQLFPVEEE